MHAWPAGAGRGMPYLLPQLVLGGRVQHHGASELDAIGVAAGATRAGVSGTAISRKALGKFWAPREAL